MRIAYHSQMSNKTMQKTNLKKTKSEGRDSSADEIMTIEKVFSNELTFLFYLNLNNIVFIPSRHYLLKNSIPSIEDLDIAIISPCKVRQKNG